MKLNWAERWAVNNPLRVLEQRLELSWVKARTRFPADCTALEIGCGRGAGAQLLAEAFQPRRLYALDLDPEMIGKARRRLGSHREARVELLVADSERLPFRGQALDAVFGFGVLHHLPVWREALGEIRRVLKPGGIYVLEELYPTLYQNCVTRHLLLHPTEDRFDGRALRRGLDGAGLKLEHAREWPGIGLLAICSRSS